MLGNTMDSMSISFHLLLFIILTDGTIDLNLPELEYVADHLKKAECRKLIALLHDPNFDIVNNIEAAERKIPDDISCLKLLIHWNSQTNEGKGETHVVLAHRLKQLGREDVADWLSKTVFHQLGQDLSKSLLSDPFKELARTNETDERIYDILSSTEKEEEEDEWLPIDVILFSAAISLTAFIVILLMRIIWICCQKKKKKERIIKVQKLQEKEYIQQRKEDTDSSESSSSFTEFDATAIYLMGIKKPTAEISTKLK